MQLVVALPLLCFCLLTFFYCRKGAGFRRSFLLSAVTIGVIVAFSTEVLSRFHLLTDVAISLVWELSSIIAAAMVIRANHGMNTPRSTTLGARSPELSRMTKNPASLIIAVIVIISGITGLLSAPNNFDSMTYHLTRVMHWIDHRSLAHYPCNYRAQLFHPPFAEFAILHLQLLADGDRFAATIQWGAMVGSILGVTLIVSKIGGGDQAQLLAAIFVATIPGGILQSQSTQNSYVLAFWLVCFVYFALEVRDSPPEHLLKPALFMGCSLGLAILTKGTSYLLAFPFVVWVAAFGVARGLARSIQIATVAIVAVLLLNAGHWARNWQWFHSPFFPDDEACAYRISSPSARLWATNMAWNLAAHLWAPSPKFAGAAQSMIERFDSMLHTGSSDPQLVAPGHRFHIGKSVLHEDLSGNPLHFLVIVVVLTGILISAIRRRTATANTHPDPAMRSAAAILLMIVAGFAGFCLGIRWMEFNVRLHLPLFVLAAVPVGVILTTPRWKPIVPVLSLALVAPSIPCLLLNPKHPLIGRNSIFCHSREEQYLSATQRFRPVSSRRQMSWQAVRARGQSAPESPINGSIRSGSCFEIAQAIGRRFRHCPELRYRQE